MGFYKSSCVPMDFIGSLWVFISLYAFLWVLKGLMGPYASIWILMGPSVPFVID